MKRLLIILLSLAVTSPISARVVLCDDNCKVEFTEGTESEPHFAVVDADNKPIFGQSVSIYYEKKCWLGGERFQINVGTCGSHDLLPEERGYTMADFYIGIGKLHANIELLETIKDALFYYAERIADIQKEVRELDELIKNPIRA